MYPTNIKLLATRCFIWQLTDCKGNQIYCSDLRIQIANSLLLDLKITQIHTAFNSLP